MKKLGISDNFGNFRNLLKEGYQITRNGDGLGKTKVLVD